MNIRLRRHFRKLHINNEIWQYRYVGGKILTFNPIDEKMIIEVADIKGVTYDELEDIIDNGGWFGVRPSEIKEYIVNNF